MMGSRQRQGQMLQTVLKVLKENPEGLPAQEVIQQVEKLLPATSSEDEDYPNRPGVRRYGNMM